MTEKKRQFETTLFTTLMVLFIAFLLTLCTFNINDNNVVEILFANIMLIAINIIMIAFNQQKK